MSPRARRSNLGANCGLYRVEDGQVIVPPSATARKGVQPLVTLTANGGARANVRVGQSVSFEGAIETPPGAGVVVVAEWDLEGAGDYPISSDLGEPARRMPW